MDSLLALETPAPPRLARAVCLQALALAGLLLLSALPWPRREKTAPPPPPAAKKQERQIRIVQLPKPAPQPAAPQPPAARPPPAPPRSAPPPAQAAAARTPPPSPIARIAADSTAVHGVRMRVL